MGRISSRVSTTTTITKTFKPTMQLRWLKLGSNRKLQQLHIETESGEQEWMDIMEKSL